MTPRHGPADAACVLVPGSQRQVRLYEVGSEVIKAEVRCGCHGRRCNCTVTIADPNRPVGAMASCGTAQACCALPASFPTTVRALLASCSCTT